MPRKKVAPEDRKRLSPDERKTQLLTEAYRQAQENGISAVNRITVGEACGVTDGLVSRYFGTVHGLHMAIVARAQRLGHKRVLKDAERLGLLSAA